MKRKYYLERGWWAGVSAGAFSILITLEGTETWGRVIIGCGLAMIVWSVAGFRKLAIEDDGDAVEGVGVIRWVRALFAWRTVRDRGVWRYQENRITGKRRAQRMQATGHQPVDRAWLEGGSDDD